MVGYAKTNNMHIVILIMCLKEDFDEEETSANTCIFFFIHIKRVQTKQNKNVRA